MIRTKAAIHVQNWKQAKGENLFNRAAMGRARFLIYPWFIIIFFFHVGEVNQTSHGQNSNDATCVVY